MGVVPDLPLSAAVSGGNITYYQGHYANGPQIDAATVRAAYAAALAAGNVVTDPVANALNNQTDKEDVYAAYGQYQFGFGPLGIIAGLRIENTQATYGGFDDSGTSAVSATCPIPDPINQPTTHVCAVSNKRSYTDFFPSVQVRYELQPDLIARAALSSTIARPGFQQVTAATTTDTVGDTITGNPNLKPTTATGLDLSIEDYLPHAGIASLGFFAKEIKNYIAQKISQQPGGQQNLGGNLGIVRRISFGNTPDVASVWFRDELRPALQRHIARSLGRPGRVRELDLGRLAVHGAGGESRRRASARCRATPYCRRRRVIRRTPRCCTTCMA